MVDTATTPTRHRSAKTENRDLRYEAEFASLGISYRYAAIVELDDIERHPESQARMREAGAGTIASYALQMRQGQPFPPVTIWEDGQDGYALLDGHTRTAARRKNGTGTTDAYVVTLTGGSDEAIAIGAALNNINGNRMNRDENRRAMLSMSALGLATKTISRKLGVSASDVTRVLASQNFDQRARRLGLVEAATIPQSLKPRLMPIADDAVFTEMVGLLIDADMTSKDLTPVLDAVRSAPSEADRLAAIAAERKVRADDIRQVASGRRAKGSPVSDAMRVVAMLRKLVDDYADPVKWVPVADEARLKLLGQLEIVAPFLVNVKQAFEDAAPAVADAAAVVTE